MKEELITFETAKLAKEKGFNIPSNFYYGALGKLHKSRQKLGQKSLKGSLDSCLTTTQSLIQKWLREKHNIHVIPIWCIDVYSCELYDMRESIKGCQKNVFGVQWKDNCTYEEALEKGLYQALKLI